MNTILLATRDPALAATCQAALQTAGAWQVLPPVHCLADARAALVRQAPALLVTDMQLRDGQAISLVRTLRLRQARTQVLVLATDEADPRLLDALQAGADNFWLVRPEASETLAVHARETLAGGADIAPWIARRLLDHFGQPARDAQGRNVEDLTNPLALTSAERLLLRQLSLGERLADVASRQGVGPREITAKVRDIYRKMQWTLHAGNLSLA